MKIFVNSFVMIEGRHHWANAPADVAYLKNPHRHLFHIRAYKQVDHLNREIEIITLGHLINQAVREMFAVGLDGVVEFAGNSCEMIAVALIEKFDLSACEVLEDGENGALIQA